MKKTNKQSSLNAHFDNATNAPLDIASGHKAVVLGHIQDADTIILRKNRFGKTGIYRLYQMGVAVVEGEVMRRVDSRKDDEIATLAMLLWCPECGERHVDEGTFATKVHHTHACQECGFVWRPAIVNTVGVRFLPGYKDR